MSIIVKGMKMPKTCYDCIFYESLECVLTGFDADRKSRHCPLIELPPHGRLIDADALFPSYADLLDGGDVQPVIPKIVIDTAPTIIESEEK